MAEKVDWIGTNIYPWWENKLSIYYPCTPAEKAADFHIARLEDLQRTYPGKEIILTEFGWPNGPEGSSVINKWTGAHCGVPSKANQLRVTLETFKQLADKKWSGVLFEAFSEPWKSAQEADFAGSWGLCAGTAPYDCLKELQLPAQKPAEKLN